MNCKWNSNFNSVNFMSENKIYNLTIVTCLRTLNNEIEELREVVLYDITQNLTYFGYTKETKDSLVHTLKTRVFPFKVISPGNTADTVFLDIGSENKILLSFDRRNLPKNNELNKSNKKEKSREEELKEYISRFEILENTNPDFYINEMKTLKNSISEENFKLSKVSSRLVDTVYNLQSLVEYKNHMFDSYDKIVEDTCNMFLEYKHIT